MQDRRANNASNKWGSPSQVPHTDIANRMNRNLNIYQSDDEDDNVWKVSSEAKAGNSIKPTRPRGDPGQGKAFSVGRVSPQRILGSLQCADSRQNSTPNDGRSEKYLAMLKWQSKGGQLEKLPWGDSQSRCLQQIPMRSHNCNGESRCRKNCKNI